MVESSQKIVEYKSGEIVRYIGYEGDLINDPQLKPIPDKYFKIKNVDMDFGIVSHGRDTIGVSNIRKTNFIEKIIYWWLWKN